MIGEESLWREKKLEGDWSDLVGRKAPHKWKSQMDRKRTRQGPGGGGTERGPEKREKEWGFREPFTKGLIHSERRAEERRLPFPMIKREKRKEEGVGSQRVNEDVLWERSA